MEDLVYDFDYQSSENEEIEDEIELYLYPSNWRGKIIGEKFGL